MNHKLGNLNFLEFVHGPESEFKEFELWFKFETRLKYGCFHAAGKGKITTSAVMHE